MTLWEMYGNGVGIVTTKNITKTVPVLIQKVLMGVGAGFSAAVPGATMLGVAVSRVGATAILMTGLATAASA